jgi:hypothetical protein
MPRKALQHRPGCLDAFVAGAGVPAAAPLAPAPAAANPPPAWPWETARPDVQKTFNVRLPEPHLVMLRYIAEHTPDSMQMFCQRLLLPAIEAEIAELIQGGAEGGRA